MSRRSRSAIVSFELAYPGALIAARLCVRSCSLRRSRTPHAVVGRTALRVEEDLLGLVQPLHDRWIATRIWMRVLCRQAIAVVDQLPVSVGRDVQKAIQILAYLAVSLSMAVIW